MHGSHRRLLMTLISYLRHRFGLLCSSCGCYVKRLRLIQTVPAK